MDLSQLDDLLEETAYVPTFNRAPKAPPQNKSLLKNDSNKSLGVANISQPTPVVSERPRTNMLQLHKDTRKEVSTFQDFFKQQAEPKIEIRPQPKTQTRDSWKTTKQEVKKDDFNMNNLLDDDDEPPFAGRRGMKPPISRKNDDAKSVASRRNDRNDDNKSVTSVAEVRKQNKEQQKPFMSFQPSPPSLTNKYDSLKENQVVKEKQAVKEKQTVKEVIRQVKEIKYGVDPELKKIMDEQLQLQRQLNEKLLKQQQEAHKAQLERLKTMHEQQIKRRIELKDFQIEKLKEYYEMQLKSKSERDQQLKGLEVVSKRVEEGIKALQRAQSDLKNKSYRMQQQRTAKGNQIKSFEDFSREKEKHIQEMFQKLQSRQKEFREEKQRILSDLDRERKRNEEAESRILKRQRELQQKFMKKERNLIDQYDDKNRKISQQQSKLRMQKIQIEQEKVKYQQEREEIQIRQRKWQENRSKMMEELQSERTKLITRQVELNSKHNQWQAKESDIQMREKELVGKLKLVELQKKKWQIEKDMKSSSSNVQTKTGFYNREKAIRQETPPSNFQKSIKQLKDEYLRNLGQL